MFLTPSDLEPFAVIAQAKAHAMIEDAEAQATLIAPCLTDPALDAAKVSAVRSILRGAVLRWNEAGSGALQAQQAGPFGVTYDNRQTRRAMFWPSEISDLQGICRAPGTSKAFDIDTAPSGTQSHADICTLNFGGAYCSCGAVLTNLFPLYGRES